MTFCIIATTKLSNKRQPRFVVRVLHDAIRLRYRRKGDFHNGRIPALQPVGAETVSLHALYGTKSSGNNIRVELRNVTRVGLGVVIEKIVYWLSKLRKTFPPPILFLLFSPDSTNTVNFLLNRARLKTVQTMCINHAGEYKKITNIVRGRRDIKANLTLKADFAPVSRLRFHYLANFLLVELRLKLIG